MQYYTVIFNNCSIVVGQRKVQNSGLNRMLNLWICVGNNGKHYIALVYSSVLVYKVCHDMFCVFSWRFSWKESTIVMAFRQCFFWYTRSDQNSSTKFFVFMVSDWTIWPSELNQKYFSIFPTLHTRQGETKGSPFSFFSTLWDIFWWFATQWRKNLKGPPGPFVIFEP